MTRVTTLYCVRHGATDWNAAGRCQGLADVPMNAMGHTQVTRLAQHLSQTRFDAAYTSPLLRARQTADLLLADSTTIAQQEPGLTELSYGAWQGLSADEWPRPAAVTWQRDPWAMEFPGGESLTRLRVRAVQAVRRIVSDHPGQTVLLSSHGHTNRVVLLEALGLRPGCFWTLVHPNASAYRIDYQWVDAERPTATSATLIRRTGSRVPLLVGEPE
jgi:broad specificity phosphatase PhoE